MSQKSNEFLGHPKGLFILFFTEMWERFSYYGMRAILTLYIVAEAKAGPLGGLGWSNKESLALYGWYTMMVYVMSIPGGILADKVLGQKKAVFLGGVLLVIGHGILALEQMWAFYSGLAFIVLGVGALKPNISTMVGSLYEQGDIRRDKGFTIFYIGINLGAFLSSIIVGYIGENIGWHYGFGLAGIGMTLGQVVYMMGQKHLAHVGNFIKEEKSEVSNELGILEKMFKDISAFLPAILIMVLGGYLGYTLSWAAGLLVAIGGLAIGVGIVAYKELNQVEKDRVIVLLISFLIVIIFWGAFEQAGGLMNIYTKERVNRVIPIIGEIPASVFQSVNAFFIMVFGTAVASFWASRMLKRKESSSIFKMAIGTMIMGTGFLFMTSAAIEVSTSDVPFYDSAALYWIIGAYLLHTIGELCASPVALSFITKLAPVKYASIMMGVYFACTGLGNKLAGVLGEAAQAEPVKTELVANRSQITQFVPDSVINNGNDINIKAIIYVNNLVAMNSQGSISLVSYKKEKDLFSLIKLDQQEKKKLIEQIKELKEGEESDKFYATLKFKKDIDDKIAKRSFSDGKNYSGTILLEAIQNKQELKIFASIAIFTVIFGLLLLALLKKLKKLTHGAEDHEHESSEF